jgi:ribosomal protein S18 acetylase RimI-like enzyme
MGEKFFFQRLTGRSPLADLGITQLSNPFCTDPYVMAMQQLGYECWVIGIRSNGVLQDATIAVVRRGRMGATLEIASLPAAAKRTMFWDGVYALSKRLKVTDLIAGTFGSPSFDMPPLRGEISRKKRIEYLLEIDNDDFATHLSSSHKKNIKSARAAGVTVRRCSRRPESLRDHVRMIGHSMDRRAARGESVSTDSVATKEHWAYLESGAGELFQAVCNGQVVSSLLFLRSARTAYSQSTGTSPEGMGIGASPFLINSICIELSREGVRTFNLGGAPEGSSLAGFKAGFGATPVTLCECECYVGPFWLKKLRSFLRLVRTDRARLLKLLLGNCYQMFVYALPTNAPMPTIPTPVGARFQPISEKDVMMLAINTNEPQFRQRQLDRLHRYGASLAYGVYIGDKLAHISWFLPPAAVALEQPVILRLDDGEAEITGCETLPEFRGRGLYPFAIQQIYQIAQDSGIRRIYMKTRKSNTSSQSGILKAGLHLTGVVTLVAPPEIFSKTFILRRFRLVS